MSAILRFNPTRQETRLQTPGVRGLEIEIRKFGASSSPELFSEEIQQLAQKLMPKAMQQESQMDIDYLRALRIVNTKGEGYFWTK